MSLTIERRGNLALVQNQHYQIDFDLSKGTWNYYDSDCLLYTSPSPRDATLSRMPSSA